MAAGIGSGFIDFSSVPQHAAGYVRIPKYVFENCNQAVRNSYEDEFLAGMRVQTQDFSKMQQVGQFLLNAGRLTKEQLVKRGEEWDWVYGLDYLEKTYLADPNFRQKKTPFTIDEIIRINGLLSRAANERPGKFREKNINWSKGDLSLNESIAQGVFQQELLRAYGEDILNELETELFSRISDPSCSKPPVLEIKVSKLRSRMEYLKCHPMETEDRNTGGWVDVRRIDPKKAEEWGRDFPGKKKGTIDAVQWLRAHFHFFPTGKHVPDELQKGLDAISHPDMHTIEKACLIWFDIVRIHISHEANKREGKAIGAAILLANGYLPPEISGEDGKRYVKLLEEGFETKDGHIPFTQFIVEMMKKTYEKYAAIPGYLEQYQAS